MKKPFFEPHGDFFIEHFKTYEKFELPIQQYHDGYELCLFIDGERFLFYNNRCYNTKRGDIAIIRPFELHYSESCEDVHYERYVINFKPDMLETILSDKEIFLLFEDFNPGVLHLSEDEMAIIYNSFKMLDIMQNKKSQFLKKATASALLSLIITLKNIPKSKTRYEGVTMSEEIIYAINYIGKHYKENISLDFLTDMIHISKFHFCRIFKEATGTTFLEYLNNIRLSHAHRLLVESDMPISDIAAKCGFASAPYFSRMFKKVHGVTPKSIRK